MNHLHSERITYLNRHDVEDPHVTEEQRPFIADNVSNLAPAGVIRNRKPAETVCLLYHQKKDFIYVPYEPKEADYLNRKNELCKSGFDVFLIVRFRIVKELSECGNKSYRRR